MSRWRRFGLSGERLTTRRVILLGIGLVCAAWLVAGYSAARDLASTERRLQQSHRDVAEITSLLVSLRVGILEASVLLRDLLVEPDAAAREDTLKQISQSRTATTQTLDRYARFVTGDEERLALQQLRLEVEAFWNAMQDAAALRRAPAADSPLEALRPIVSVRREAVLALADHIQQLHQRALDRLYAELSVAYATARRGLFLAGAVALVFSFLVTLASVHRVAALERVLERQRLEDARKTRDLQRLSARAMTAQDDERRLIARDLHDDVGQALMAVKMELAVVQRRMETGQNPDGILDEARAMTESALESVRNLSRLYHPSVLDDFGLPVSLGRLADGVSARTGTQVRLVSTLTGDRFSPEIETCAYRFVQEALTNVVKHSGAAACTVTAWRTADTLSVTVEDDGRGFDPADPETRKHGLGLLSLQERAGALGGRVRVTSAAGTGTRLELSVPATPIVRPQADHGEDGAGGATA